MKSPPLKRIAMVSLIAGALIVTPSAARDSKRVFELLQRGQKLSALEAQRLENKIRDKPNDEEARIQLLSYYATRPKDVALDVVKSSRARHILWLIEHDPKEGYGLFEVANGVHQINCTGDDLADAGAFQRARELWVDQVKKHSSDAALRREAVRAIRYCAPEQAEDILKGGPDIAGLGELYAVAVLGITGETYRTNSNEPQGSDPAFRQRPFAEKARQLLERSTEKDLVVAAARTMLREGAILWADGKLDWDYTVLGNSLLARAKQLEPNNLALLALPKGLPAPGQRPPMTFRVGGNVQAAIAIRREPPVYPAAARSQGIQGIVRLSALIGLDGKVMALRVLSGPAELVRSALEAVGRWEYKPTLLNGKPCYVITGIDVTYTLSAQ